MSVDRNVMQRITRQLYMTPIRDEHGDAGEDALLQILDLLLRIYDHVDPEGVSGRLFVYRALTEDKPAMPVLESASTTQPLRFGSIEHLAQGYGNNARKRDTVIHACRDGDLLLWAVDNLDVERLARHGVLYMYHARTDYFRINSEDREVLNPDRTHASVYAIPTFRNLRDALERYKWEAVRTSRCSIFSSVWEDGEHSKRLFFKNSPEKTLRRSLDNYLKISLRGAEVRPEQNVDESHPVDIKVTWTLNTMLALIEIKWLGKARDATGHVTQEFYDSRARAGAKQLADYLDSNASQAPAHESKGYLIVIDARRRGLGENSTSVDQSGGMYYAEREIEYDPKFHETRDDFEEPIRMFAAPICR